MDFNLPQMAVACILIVVFLRQIVMVKIPAATGRMQKYHRPADESQLNNV